VAEAETKKAAQKCSRAMGGLPARKIFEQLCLWNARRWTKLFERIRCALII